ncbi:MAG: FHA domain-containing protein [bacterium]|nr:FHA domain-containing protein [bacterium]
MKSLKKPEITKIIMSILYGLTIIALFMKVLYFFPIEGPYAVSTVNILINKQHMTDFLGYFLLQTSDAMIVRFMILIPFLLSVGALACIWRMEHRITIYVTRVASSISALIYIVALLYLTALSSKAAEDGILESFEKATKTFEIGFWLVIISHVLIIVFPLILDRMFDSVRDTNLDGSSPAMTPGVNKPKTEETHIKPGGLIGICGTYNGSKIELAVNEQIMIGRDSAECNLVIVAPKVSRKHCLIQYLGKEGYKITDFSSNGTFRNTDERLAKQIPVVVPAGTMISLGNQENVFRLV